MRGLSHLFLYVVYFFQADTKEARKRAETAARNWCIQRNPHWTDRYWQEYFTFTRTYMLHYCQTQAKKRLDERNSNVLGNAIS
jgi:hypothetical protein